MVRLNRLTCKNIKPYFGGFGEEKLMHQKPMQPSQVNERIAVIIL